MKRLLSAFLLPAPLAATAAPVSPTEPNAHVLRRLESPERMRAVEEAARMDAAARAAYAEGEATVAPERQAAAPLSPSFLRRQGIQTLRLWPPVTM